MIFRKHLLIFYQMTEAITNRPGCPDQCLNALRTPKSGETLRVVTRAGSTWQKEGRRGGTLTFTETFTDYLDSQGDVVVTARLVGVMTSQVVE